MVKGLQKNKIKLSCSNVQVIRETNKVKPQSLVNLIKYISNYYSLVLKLINSWIPRERFSLVNKKISSQA